MLRMGTRIVQRVVKEVEEITAESYCGNHALYAVLRDNVDPDGNPVLLALCPTELVARDVAGMIKRKITSPRELSVYIKEVDKKDIRL